MTILPQIMLATGSDNPSSERNERQTVQMYAANDGAEIEAMSTLWRKHRAMSLFRPLVEVKTYLVSVSR